MAWFDSLAEVPGLPGFVLMELVAGCQSKKDIREAENQTSQFLLYWPTTADCELALDIFTETRFKSGMSMLDAVIGAISLGLSATLYTFNTKHFKDISGLDCKAPYVR